MTTREFQHWSHAEFDLYREFQYEPPDTFKPTGFWIADGDEWPEFCRDSLPSRVSVCYRVDVEMEGVLLLDTVDKLDDFTEEFSFVPEWMRHVGLIDSKSYVDWRVVQDRWRGVVFSPYHWSTATT